MTPEKQIKALAELEFPQHKWEHILDPDCKTWVVGFRYPAGRGYIPANRYRESYDAIIPLIQKQDVKIRHAVGTEHRAWNFMRSPAQLCEALLRATGKWEE